MFSAEDEDSLVLQQKCQQALMDTLRLEIAVAILSANDLRKALDHAPAWWDRDNDSKHNVIFVIAPADTDSIMMSVGQLKPEYEQVSHFGRIIFWSAPLKTFSRTRWSKIVSMSVYSSVTIRNANTVKKLSQLANNGVQNVF